MEAAEYWNCRDAAGAISGAMDRRVFAQGEVSSHTVVIVRVGFENSAQVGFAEHDDVVEAFAADRADEAF